MSLTGLLEVLRGDPALAEAVRAAGAGDRPRPRPRGRRPAPAAAVLAALASDGAAPLVLAVTATAREAEDLAAALRATAARPSRWLEFPAWETLPHERLSPRSRHRRPPAGGAAPAGPPRATTRPRPRSRVVVAPVRSVLQPLVTGLGDLRAGRAARRRGRRPGRRGRAARRRRRTPGSTWSSERGEFAVRGGILDVFPPTEEHPLRVEFWGDTVEEIRWFKVADQRSLEVAEGGLCAPPCRELLLDRRRAGAGRGARRRDAPRAAPRCSTSSPRASRSRAWSRWPRCWSRTAMELLVDQLPAGDRVVVVCDPERVRTRAHDLVATRQEFLEASWGAAAVGGDAPIDLGAAAYRALAEVRAHAVGGGRAVVDADAVRVGRRARRPRPRGVRRRRGAGAGRARRRGVPRRHRPRARRRRAACSATAGGSSSSPRATAPPQRLVERAAARPGVPARLEADLDGRAGPAGGARRHRPASSTASSRPALRLLVLTETDLVGQKSSTKDMRRLPSRRRNVVDPLQLQARRLRRARAARRRPLRRDGAAHGRRRHPRVPRRSSTPRASAASPATGSTCRPTSSTRSPATSAARRRRCTSWAAPTGPRPRARARKAVREIAAELIQLYAARMASPGPRLRAGHAVAARARGRLRRTSRRPTSWPASTRSRPTWSSSVPMDRLICGDVGYGKTEIAVRAAFKAVQDGKQVAVLVPTTLLVQQHFIDVRRAATRSSRSWCARCRASRPTREARAGARRPRRRHGRHRHRHPPAARQGGPLQGPRPGHRRRGAALRRRAQGAR